MKTRGLIVLLLISLFLLGNVSAQSLENLSQQVENTAGTIKQIQNNPAEFLKERWTDYFSKTAVGKFFIGLGNFLEYLNPLWKIMPGLPFAWSGPFLLSFVLLVTIYITIRRILSLVELKDYILILIALGITLILSLTKLISYLGIGIANWINSLTSIILQLLAYIAFIVIIVYLSAFSSFFRRINEARKKEKKIKKAEEEAEEAKEEVEELKEEVREKAKREEETPEEKIGRETLRKVGKTIKELSEEE